MLRKDIKARYQGRTSRQISKKDEKEGCHGWKSRKGFKKSAKKDGKI
jgi:hypothetical protein